VAAHGSKAWALAASQIPNRSGKQCRERYLSALNPAVKTGDWTADEDARIFALQKLHGNQVSRFV